TSTPDFGGRLTWSVTQLTTLSLTGLMTFNTGTPGSTTSTIVSTTGGTTFIAASAGNSYLSRTIAANANHELLPNLLANLNATYGNFTFQGVTRTDNFFIVDASLRYLVNRNLFLGGSYLFTQYTSTIPRSSFNQNILTLRVGTQF
ncbi:MAG TPA: outer membrane beta-barrel protein, partial [Chthoniobacterales bacterium]|nr:outer membrane beta-barrel protein [Chthoniobacterales bacterium]